MQLGANKWQKVNFQYALFSIKITQFRYYYILKIKLSQPIKDNLYININKNNKHKDEK